MAKIGDIIGNYQLLEELASGSFGSVYRGVHTILTTRVVAIKILHMHLHRQQESASFFHEARILEALQHPHILHIFDVGLQENMPYIVTTFAPGGSLRQYLHRHNGKPLPIDEAISLLKQVAQALDYAHRQNIIHRDLKPENLLFDAQGNMLLADFGISSILGSMSFHQTSPYGTPAYMAPEQFKGEVSRESDQYALACIAYELLTGQKPFTAPDVIALGFKHLMEPVLPPQRLNPNLPEYIDQAIIRSLSKERKQRFPNILTFIAALQTSPKTSQQWLTESNALYDNKKYEEAIQACDQAIRLDPTNALAYYNKGNTLDDLKRYEEAIQAYDQAIRLDPTNALAYNNKGTTLSHIEDKGKTLDDLKRYEEAIQAYDQAIRLDPTNALAYYNKGTTLSHIERPEEAIQAYDQAIRLDPTNALAYYNKGTTLSHPSRKMREDFIQTFAQAIQAYDQAIHLDPTNAAAYTNKGYALRDLERYEEAIQAYDQAIRLDPTNALAYYHKGHTLGNLKRYEEALQASIQADHLNLTYSFFYYHSYHTFHNLKGYEEAKKAYQKAYESKNGKP